MWHCNEQVAEARQKALTAKYEEFLKMKVTPGAKRFEQAFRTRVRDSLKKESVGGIE